MRYILLLVLTALLLWGVFWARGRAQDDVCRQVLVEVENADSATLVTPQGILTDLQHQNFRLKGLPMWQINTNQVEQFLRKSPFLESASVVKGADGQLLIVVRQIVPVLRIMDGNDSYYVNRQGKRMPASANYFADVPVVSGHFTKAYGPERLLPMIQYVEADPTLRSIVSMYNFVDSSNVFIIPVFAGHVVNLGSIQGYESKFQKLMLFYRKVMPAKGWDLYDTLSLKWNHQVVAHLRHLRAGEQVEYDPADDEQIPDLETMTTGNTEANAAVKSSAQSAKKQNEPKKADEPAKKQEKQEKKASEPDKKQEAKKEPAKKQETKKQPAKKQEAKKQPAKKQETKKAADKKKPAVSNKTTKNKKK